MQQRGPAQVKKRYILILHGYGEGKHGLQAMFPGRLLTTGLIRHILKSRKFGQDLHAESGVEKAEHQMIGVAVPQRQRKDAVQLGP